MDLLANAIGDYKGTAAFNVNGINKVRSLSITADGLAAHGVQVKWGGSVHSRIEITPFLWQKRHWTSAP
ncbi:MAG TPA: hypothetical protein VM347_34125 [Nonomuraea sp.]|nr:hypothetical protein [Nonomuraea sp.]